MIYRILLSRKEVALVKLQRYSTKFDHSELVFEQWSPFWVVKYPERFHFPARYSFMEANELYIISDLK